MEIKHLTTADFDEFINSEPKVLVDFWATWCGPCKMISPVLEEIAAEDPDFKIAKVDVDQNPDLARRFAVRSIPTLVLFKDGKQAAVTLGAMPKPSILEFAAQ